MSTHDCLLTLDMPRALEDGLADILRADTLWSARIHRVHSESMGASVVLGRSLEKMRGSAQRTQFSLLMMQSELPLLLDTLRQRLPGADLHWWVTPVLASGTLA